MKSRSTGDSRFSNAPVRLRHPEASASSEAQATFDGFRLGKMKLSVLPDGQARAALLRAMKDRPASTNNQLAARLAQIAPAEQTFEGPQRRAHFAPVADAIRDRVWEAQQERRPMSLSSDGKRAAIASGHSVHVLPEGDIYDFDGPIRGIALGSDASKLAVLCGDELISIDGDDRYFDSGKDISHVLWRGDALLEVHDTGLIRQRTPGSSKLDEVVGSTHRAPYAVAYDGAQDQVAVLTKSGDLVRLQLPRKSDRRAKRLSKQRLPAGTREIRFNNGGEVVPLEVPASREAVRSFVAGAQKEGVPHALSPDGMVAAKFRDDKEIITTQGDTFYSYRPVHTVGLSPNGTHAALLGESTLTVADLKHGREKSYPGNELSAVTWMNDAEILVGAPNGQISILPKDAKTPVPLTKLDFEPFALAVNTNCTEFAVGSRTGEVRRYRLDDLALVGRAKVRPGTPSLRYDATDTLVDAIPQEDTAAVVDVRVVPGAASRSDLYSFGVPGMRRNRRPGNDSFERHVQTTVALRRRGSLHVADYDGVFHRRTLVQK